MAKLHHTVPKFYLRGFANDAERITTVRLPGDNQYTQIIDKTATTNHFYSIDSHPQGADVFETALSDMERSEASVHLAGSCSAGFAHGRNHDHVRVASQMAATAHHGVGARALQNLVVRIESPTGLLRVMTEYKSARRQGFSACGGLCLVLSAP
jgi:hypothetical protein